MEGLVNAFEARRHFGKLLQSVTTDGDSYVVERHGQPVAAIVPIEVYEQWKRQRSEVFTRWRLAAERADLSPEDADALAKEAVESIRQR